jgi:hypothetical protein
MAKLMYSGSDQVKTIEQLRAVPTPAPLGRFHKPVGFGQFADVVKHRLALAGIDVTGEEYVVTADNQSFFGTLSIGVNGFQRDDMDLTIGIRGSHNQKIPRGLCMGTRVIVCSNLCFTGNLANLVTKQTTNIWDRLPGMVENAVSRIPAMAEREVARVGAFKAFQMKPRWGDAALVLIHRNGGMSAAQLGRAVQEWDAPTYEEHTENGFTAWRLLNAVTEAQKPSGDNCNMDTIRERTMIASRFIEGVVGF